MISSGGMVAVDSGALPWFRPSDSGEPPSPPPWKPNMTQSPLSPEPLIDSALIVP